MLKNSDIHFFINNTIIVNRQFEFFTWRASVFPSSTANCNKVLSFSCSYWSSISTIFRLPFFAELPSFTTLSLTRSLKSSISSFLRASNAAAYWKNQKSNYHLFYQKGNITSITISDEYNIAYLRIFNTADGSLIFEFSFIFVHIYKWDIFISLIVFHRFIHWSQDDFLDESKITYNRKNIS